MFFDFRNGFFSDSDTEKSKINFTVNMLIFRYFRRSTS